MYRMYGYCTTQGQFFSLKHFGHFSWDIFVTAAFRSFALQLYVFKLAIEVFLAYILQTFWPKWLNIFGHLKNVSVYDRKTTEKNGSPGLPDV